MPDAGSGGTARTPRSRSPATTTVVALQYRLDGGDWTTYSAPVALPAGSYHDRLPRPGTNLQWSDEWTLDVSVDGPAPSATVKPRISGTAAVGGLLSATTGTWDTSGLAFSYQWLRDGAPLGGATARTYRVRPADVGHRLAVRVTATGTGVTPGESTSTPTAVVRRAATTVRVSASDATPRVNQWVRLAVRVVPNPAAAPVAGRVEVYVAGRRVATRVLRDGRAVVPVRATRPGATRVVVRYLGSAAAAPSRGALTVRAHR